MGVRLKTASISNDARDEISETILVRKPSALINGVSLFNDNETEEALVNADCSDNNASSNKRTFADEEQEKQDAARRAKYQKLHIKIDDITGHRIYMDMLLDHPREVFRMVSDTRLSISSSEPSDEDILMMLLAAKDKFGDKFKVFGTDEFIARCTEIAISNKIEMRHSKKQDLSVKPKF